MKRTVCVILLLALSSCASPTFQMTPEQVAGLSDDQLCNYRNNYRGETKMNAEIERRGLNCDRHYRECLKRGNQPGTEAMGFCVALLRENERLRYDPPYDDWNMFGGPHYRHAGPRFGY